jgi:hypothetical protein
LARDFVNWVAGCALIFAAMFGVGKLILGESLAAAGYLAAGVVCSVVIGKNLRTDKI